MTFLPPPPVTPGPPDAPDPLGPEVWAALGPDADAGDAQEAALLAWLGQDPRAVPDPETARARLEGEAAHALALVAPDRLSPHVRAAVVALPRGGGVRPPIGDARETRPRPRPAPVPPIRLGPGPRRRARPAALRAVAILLLALAATWWATSGGDAEAGLSVAGIDRIRLAVGGAEVGSGRTLAPGDRVEARPDEIVAVRLADGPVVVVGAGGGVEVAEAPWAGLGALLRLRGGALRLRSAGRPLPLLLDDSVVLELLDGEACAQGAGGGASIALPDRARGRLLRPGAAPRPLAGPVEIALGEGGGDRVDVRAAARPASTCPDLGLALGFRAPDPAGRVVGAARWRVRAGAARRTGRRLLLAPSPGERTVTVAWQPATDVRRTRTLLLELETAADGITVTVGPRPLASEAWLPSDGAPVALPLPDGWFEALAGRELELTFTFPDETSSPPAVGLDAVVWKPGSEP